MAAAFGTCKCGRPKAEHVTTSGRTPRGKARPDGALAGETPHGLVTHLVDALCDRGRDARAIDQFTLGCVGQVGAQGGHIAMVAKMAAELPDACVVHSINNFCASGLTAIGLSMNAIEAGQATRALAGGVEMMSRVSMKSNRMGKDNMGPMFHARYPDGLVHQGGPVVSGFKENTLGQGGTDFLQPLGRYAELLRYRIDQRAQRDEPPRELGEHADLFSRAHG